MNYERQLKKVIEFIGNHIDDKLTLTQLSDIACFSKYHFHRLFTAYTGLSLQQYIRWLRLKRAAHQLIVDKNKLIIEIAINAGFESHESFTRAFKLTCGLSPSEFRSQPSWQAWEQSSYCLPKRGEMMIDVNIKNIKARRLAVLEHRGSFEKRFPAGRYAVEVHKGSRDDIGDTVYGLYHDWLPKSDETLGDLPCIFCYYNFDHEVAETESLTECWLLLKKNECSL